jgi:hypothetical protein
MQFYYVVTTSPARPTPNKHANWFAEHTSTRPVSARTGIKALKRYGDVHLVGLGRPHSLEHTAFDKSRRFVEVFAVLLIDWNKNVTFHTVTFQR